MEEAAGRHQQQHHFWGDDPADEEEYYASQGIRGTTSFFASPGGFSLFTRSWLPSSSPPRALVCMIHGYGNDISWTFQATPIFLACHGFACCALDLPGHGRSPGLRAFLPDLSAVADDCLTYFDSVRRSPELRGLPCFLYGESMGGALCLLIHLRDRRPEAGWRGAVLVAPMCKISDSIRPRWPIPQILTFVARLAPTLPIVPTADLVDKSVKVEAKRKVAASNPLRYRGKPRLGTVVELLRATDDLGSHLTEVTIPFLVLHGSADVVTDPAVSQALYDAARSEDKTIRIYEGMMHSLLFGETDENVALVRNDILTWLDERCGGA
ncbi:caffeoylshikimate esterase [Elaeis guineensis]|uniref:Caffeoylshikimate esterase n=1 Tax=Elaeis guineensis var. tenera TaxID=51953 RepID=A0A6I9QAG3_ELAGV|nr:caffeoylshikimate esterase [Elaeis guineensis]